MAIADDVKAKVRMQQTGKQTLVAACWASHRFHSVTSDLPGASFYATTTTCYQCESTLEATFVECVDVSGGGCEGAKLELIVVSPKFAGMPLLKRHRAVNDALAEFMPQIHALTMKTWTPEQYQEKQ